MCRIVGFWDFSFNGQYNIEQVITEMRDTMVYGGPDDEGFFVNLNNGLALGHRRLSIIDLSSFAHQPMEFDNLVIIHNGEVYNFLEIKNYLLKKGYTFISNSDTEVILKAFHAWGLNALELFRGMFAFAIYDKKKNELTIVRDRLGVKPLYYYFKDNIFIFASEIKAFHKHPYFKKKLNLNALSLYLQLGYIPSPYSIFENLYKLEPGFILKLNHKGNLEKINYWNIKNYFTRNEQEKEKFKKKNIKELVDELENLLIDSFKLRLISDVPIGLFLSGGIDSTTVCALLSVNGYKLKTFTIGFYEKEYNEANYAKKIAKYFYTEHTEYYCTSKDCINIINKIPIIFDEPFGDSSAIPTYLLSELTRKSVKVALSADGGDEQFCGYTRYFIVKKLVKKYLRNPIFFSLFYAFNLIPFDLILKLFKFSNKFIKQTNINDKIIKLKQILKIKDPIIQYEYTISNFLDNEIFLMGLPKDKKLSDWLDIETNDILSKMMYLDIKTYLPDDLLVKVDRATMAVSLEGREPLLDHKIVEWTSILPSEFKLKNKTSKYILRQILYKYIPKELIDRPKQGFGIPLYHWLKNDNDINSLIKKYLDLKKIKDEGIFKPEPIQCLLENFKNNKIINFHKLWFLLIFELWKEKWL